VGFFAPLVRDLITFGWNLEFRLYGVSEGSFAPIASKVANVVSVPNVVVLFAENGDGFFVLNEDNEL
jgi:hypothetical protein